MTALLTHQIPSALFSNPAYVSSVALRNEFAYSYSLVYFPRKASETGTRSYSTDTRTLTLFLRSLHFKTKTIIYPSCLALDLNYT